MLSAIDGPLTNQVWQSGGTLHSCRTWSMIVGSLVNQTYFFSFYIRAGKKIVWCNSVALFALPDPQILEMLIGMDRVERPANEVRVTLN